jgi:hypothetical protein
MNNALQQNLGTDHNRPDLHSTLAAVLQTPTACPCQEMHRNQPGHLQRLLLHSNTHAPSNLQHTLVP